MDKSAKDDFDVNTEIARQLKAYFRLGVQVSVATTLIAIYAIDQLNHIRLENLIFLVLLAGGHLTNLLSPPRAAKLAAGVVTVVGGVGSYAFDPTGTTAIALLAGLLSGGLSILSASLDARSGLIFILDRVLTLHIIYRISEFLEALGWKREHWPELSLSGKLSKLDSRKKLSYRKGGWISNKSTVSLNWADGLAQMRLVYSPTDSNDLFQEAEFTAIKDYVEYQRKLSAYVGKLTTAANVPVEIAETAIRQIPTLLDKYRNPENYITRTKPNEDDQSQDVVERLLGWSEKIGVRPRPEREALQGAVLTYYDAVGRRKRELERERERGSEKWNNFERALEAIRNRAGQEEKELVTAVFERLNEQLKQ